MLLHGGPVTWRGLWGHRDGLVVMVGDRGAIARSADCGHRWLGVRSPTLWPLRAVHARRSWMLAVGAGGTIVRSDTRGARWTRVRQGGESLRGVAFGPGGRAVAVGDGGALLASADGGVTWAPGRAAGLRELCAVACDDAGTFHILCREGVLLSGAPDSGWIGTALEGASPGALAVQGAMVAVGDAQGRAWLSRDRGVTWSAFAAGGGAGRLADLWIHPDGDRLLGVGPGGTAVWSDGGPWRAVDLGRAAGSDLHAVWGDGRGAAYALGAEATVLASSDDGYAFGRLEPAAVKARPSPWSKVRAAGRLSGLLVLPQHLLAFGDRGAISRSADLGASWAPGEIDAPAAVHDAWSADATVVHAAAAGRMFRSEDGGCRWKTSLRCKTPVLRVAGVSEQHRFAVTERSLLVPRRVAPWWKEVALPGGLSAADLAVSDDGGVIVVGTGGRIARSADRGATWSETTVPGVAALRAVAAGPGGTVHAVGAAGAVIRSADGGASWSRVEVPVPGDLLDVVVRGEEVFACGEDGVILWSVDRGRSYDLEVSGVGLALHRVAIARDHVWALGQDGEDALLLARTRKAHR